MLVIDEAAVAAIARRHHVQRLVLFGSGTTDTFDAERSDADFLVEFSPTSATPFEDYFGLKEELEELLARPVDLVTSTGLENPHFARAVEASAVEIYAA
jgi:predicted nucleotidyltransferase